MVRAVGNEPAAATPGNRFHGLVDGFLTGSSFGQRFGAIWRTGSASPSPSQKHVPNVVRADRTTTQLPVSPTSNVSTSTSQLPFRHQATKSSSPNTSVSSQPVLVRTYTRVDNNRSRPASANPGPISPRSMPTAATLPSVDAFSFDGILRAIEPDITDAIDGIAEIYARSKLSLADEYGAHLPPQGEIILSPRQLRHSGLAIRTAGLERTLTTVTEASSSSERLVSGSKAGSVASAGKGKVTAYGSLRSIISRGRSSSRSSAVVPDTPTRPRAASTSWSISGERDHLITVRTQTVAPNQLSLASVAELPRDKNVPQAGEAEIASEPTAPVPYRSASWLSWGRSRAAIVDERSQARRRDAESALKSVLQMNEGAGRAAVVR